MSDVAVLKIGGSEITDKKNEVVPIGDMEEIYVHELVEKYFRRSDVKRYGREILASGRKDIALIHGAGAVAHYLLEAEMAAPGMIIDAASYTDQLFCETMEDVGLPLRRHDPSALVRKVASGIDYSNLIRVFRRDMVDEKIPVSFGTLVESEVGGLQVADRHYENHVVLSGDVIPVVIGAEIGAERLFFTSDQKGIYDRNPAEEGAQLISKITPDMDVGHYSIKGREKDVSGGPRGKVQLLQRAAKEHLLTSYIFSALKPGNITKMLTGDLSVAGTVIAPA